MASSDGQAKRMPEWPPHPDRVFMALAAAWFETDANPEEGEVLRWIEQLKPPSIVASGFTVRKPTVAFVPVNVNSVKSFADYRVRKARGFPVAIPYDPVVSLVWPDTDIGDHKDGLKRLATKVTHVGHSASMVQAWVDEDVRLDPKNTWTPEENSFGDSVSMRVPSEGRIDRLMEAYNVNNVNKDRTWKIYPPPGRWERYIRSAEVQHDNDIPSSIWMRRLIVFSIDQPLSLNMTLRVTHALRGALLKACSAPYPEWLSGHQPKVKGSGPTEKPHLAIFPLPYVGSEYADGTIKGIGLAVPSAAEYVEVRNCLKLFLDRENDDKPYICRLFDGKHFECNVKLHERNRRNKHDIASLDFRTWTNPSSVWSSVTPIVLNRHYKGRDMWVHATEDVKEACTNIGLPKPRAVYLRNAAKLSGVPLARDFPRLMRKSDQGKCSHYHAVIVFDRPIRGPVAIGAGRFKGYGFCRPERKKRDKAYVQV